MKKFRQLTSVEHLSNRAWSVDAGGGRWRILHANGYDGVDGIDGGGNHDDENNKNDDDDDECGCDSR